MPISFLLYPQVKCTTEKTEGSWGILPFCGSSILFFIFTFRKVRYIVFPILPDFDNVFYGTLLNVAKHIQGMGGNVHIFL